MEFAVMWPLSFIFRLYLSISVTCTIRSECSHRWTELCQSWLEIVVADERLAIYYIQYIACKDVTRSLAIIYQIPVCSSQMCMTFNFLYLSSITRVLSPLSSIVFYSILMALQTEIPLMKMP